MAYSTLDDLKKISDENSILQLTDDENAGSINLNRVNKAIADADELIDGYLRGRYTLPLDPLPGLLVKFSAEIALYNLHGRRPQTDMPDTIKKKYDDTIKLLERIQQGKLTLGVADIQTPEPESYKTNKTDEDREFSKDVLKRF